MPREAPAAPPPAGSWSDPGYFRGRYWLLVALRLLTQSIRPPRGHRTYPTKTGTLLIIFALAVGTAAFNTAHNILYIALSLLLTSIILSGVLSWLNFKGCRWRLEVEPHARAGDCTPVRLRVRNANRFLPIYAVWFQIRAHQQGRIERLALEDRLDPGREVELCWLFRPEKRGQETIELEAIVSLFPFGFLRKSIACQLRREITIWPRRLDYQFQAPGAQLQAAQARQFRRGGGAELLKVRPYTPGDSLRQMHWKATARLRRLMVRETGEEAGGRYWCQLDAHHGLWRHPEQFEVLCAFAASLMDDLFRADRLAGLVVEDEVLPVHHLEDLHEAFSRLALLRTSNHMPNVAPVRGVVLTFRPRGSTGVDCLHQNHVVGQA